MKTLKAKEGYYLTQSADLAIQNRVISECLYLPDTEDVSEWKEITSKEADEFKTQLDAYNESQKTADVDNSLEDAIAKKLQEITDYDNSQNVNAFIYNGIVAWFDADERKSYEQSILSCETLGITTINVPISENIVNMKVSDAKIMLAKMHLYADACYLVTMQHKSEVSKMTSVAEVEAYDITKGYPDKLAF